MGTRGAYGFYKGGINKITYNHWDSYFEGLGVEIVKFIKSTTIKQMNEIFDKIILIDEFGKPPTPEQIKTYEKFLNTQVSSQSEKDWYCLLYGTKQNLSVYKEEGIEHMTDSWEFLKDSLYCEWGYIINLDTNMLEVCGGFNHNAKLQHPRYKKTKKQAQAMYADWKNDAYKKERMENPHYSVALLYTYPLEAIQKGCDPFYVKKMFSKDE